MAYADLADIEGVQSQFLIVIKPRRIITGWSLVSGNIYKVSFTLGQPVEVTDDGTAMSEVSTSALSSGQFYYDEDNEELYVRLPDDDNPANDTMVVTYEIWTGTYDGYGPRVPTDSSTRDVYWEPVLTKSPSVKSTMSDTLFGFLQQNSFSFTLSNATHIFEKHLINSSFKKAAIDVYQWLDEFTVANTSLLVKGTVKNLTYNDQTINITGFDNLDLLTDEFRNPTTSFATVSDFANLDPSKQNAVIPYLYGHKKGIEPINTDFLQDSPTTSDNRQYIVYGDVGPSEDTSTVPASPTSTTTRTYIADASGLQVGDTVWIDKTTDEYRVVTAVSYTGNNYIEHAALVSGAAASGDTVKWGSIRRVDIWQDGVQYIAMYNRDYTVNTNLGSKGVCGFTFQTTMESNISFPATLTPSDKIFVTASGPKNDVTLGGSAFGIDSAIYDTLADPIVILWDLLKRAGIEESQMDGAAFTALQADNTNEISMLIPEGTFGDFGTYKDAVIRILKTLLLRLYVDSTGLISVSQMGPLGAADKTIEDDEIAEGSFRYEVKYDDLASDVELRYKITPTQNIEQTVDVGYQVVTSSSPKTKYLHLVDKLFVHESLHQDSTDAQTLSDRIQYVLSEPSERITIRTEKRFLLSDLSDVIDVTRARMPGYDYDVDTDRTVSAELITISRGQKVELTLETQPGIQNNEGSW